MITGGPGNDSLIGTNGNDEIDGAGGDDSLIGGIGNDTLRGDSGNDTLDGGIGNDFLESGATGDLVDVLTGGAGNDTLVDGSGADKLIGGTGNDRYVVDGAAIVELAGQGIDTIETGQQIFTLDLPELANIENLALTGGIGSEGTGNRLNNLIAGTAGNDTLRGGIGNDTLVGGAGVDLMIGGVGNDTYDIDDAKDAVDEKSNDGTDTVRTALSQFSLDDVAFANVENLQLLAGAVEGKGNSLNNTIFGNEDVNILNGGAGNDTLIGGKGSDVYSVDSAGDKVVELGDGGDTDQVLSLISYTLSANVEDLILNAIAATVGVGNGGDNEIADVAGGSSKLFGLLGNDTLFGGGGDDTLDGGAGNDLLSSGAGIVDDVDLLIGGAGNDTLIGNDTLVGVIGIDKLIGGTGNDTYRFDTGIVVELAGQGIDTIETGRQKFTLDVPEFANIERLVFLDTGPANGIEGTGNRLNNLIVGTSATDTLSGGIGNDTLSFSDGEDLLAGGVGNDTYDILVDGNFAFDGKIVEASAEGIDTVRSALFQLALDRPDLQNVENLQLIGDAFLGGGNSLNNVIVGNDRSNDLIGLEGNDTLIGGTGNDAYSVDSAGDKVIELRRGGDSDKIRSEVSYTLSENVENLFLVGDTATVGVGNAGDNLIVDEFQGTGFANSKLSGLLGNDTLLGRKGDDTLDGGVGNDLLNSGTAITDGVDVLIGGAGNDTLIDGDNFDKLIGGTGNDTYRTGAGAFVVVELAGQGIDTIETESLSFSLDFPEFANIENLVLTATNGAIGTGNRLNNLIVGSENGIGDILTGGLGNDTLNGGGGGDVLRGGTGNDTYVIDSNSDSVDEKANEGIDTIQSSLSAFRLDGVDFLNVENLQLLTAALNGTGNSLNNAITGNGNANKLDGGLGNDSIFGNAGDDSLDGGGGIDRLDGGAGDDTYSVDNGKDAVVEAANSGQDKVLSDAGSYVLSANIEDLQLLGAALNGTGNGIANLVFGNGNDNKLSGLGGKDTMSGGAGKDTLDGGDFNDLLLGELGEDSLLGGFGNDSLDGGGGNDSLVGGSGTDNLLGGDGNDLMLGGDGNDVFDGQAGLDSLAGGAGNDFYFVDSGTDLVTEGVGQGTDTVSASGDFTITLGANVEILILTADADGVGNASANLIDGSRFASGNNSMNGGGGNDTLVGGDGFDTMTGGTGRDIFAFTNTDVTPEFITDFTAGKAGDRLDLSDLLTGFSPGNSNLADFLQFVNAAGNTIVQVDADGAANGANFVDACLLQNVTVTLAQATADGSLILT